MSYAAPTSIDDAVTLLHANPGARVLAGGTDLLVRMKGGFAEPDTIVDIKRIPGLRDISQTKEGGWRIGAGVSGAEMGENAALVADWPGVVEAVELIGSTQVQGRATAAGNLCNASPAADSVPALVAAGALAEIAGPYGMRTVAVTEIPTGPGVTSLGKGEFITALILPPKPQGGGDAYLRFIPRTEMDIAVVGCAVALTLDTNGVCTSARVALGAVAPTVIEVPEAATALIGTDVTSALEALGDAASNAATPIDDKRGTLAFRKEVSGVLARRAATIALARAKGA